MIIALVVICGGAAYGLSRQQTPTYLAEARLSFSDPTEDLDILGRSSNARANAQFQASSGAQTAVRPEVVAAVKRQLRTGRSEDYLRGSVEAAVETLTGLVVVGAETDDKRFSVRVANTFARVVRETRTKEVRDRYARAAEALRKRFKRISAARGQPLLRAGYQEQIARLRALREIAQPVKLEEPADEASQVGPNPVRDGILGAIVGLVIAIVAAFVRDSLDVRLKGPSQIQSVLGLPLLASVSEDALGSAGPEGGRRKGSWERDGEAVRILRRNLELLRGDKPMRSIAVASARPEEGKSTVAAALAWAHAKAGARTLLIDCDLRQPALAERLGVPRVPGLTDYLLGKAGIQDVLQPVPVESGVSMNGVAPDGGDGASHPLLTCITAGSPTDAPVEMVETGAFRDFLAVLSRSYDKVIIDTSPMLPVADTLELLGIVDAVVVCVRTSHTTRDQGAAVRSILAKFNDRPAGLVITGASPEDYPAYGYYQTEST